MEGVPFLHEGMLFCQSNNIICAKCRTEPYQPE